MITADSALTRGLRSGCRWLALNGRRGALLAGPHSPSGSTVSSNPCSDAGAGVLDVQSEGSRLTDEPATIASITSLHRAAPAVSARGASHHA